MRSELEAVEERAMGHRLAAVEALLEVRAGDRPTWLAKWLEPGTLISLGGIVSVLIASYFNIQTAITAVENKASNRADRTESRLDSLSTELRSNTEDDQRRTQKYVPEIEKTKAAMEMQHLVNDQVNDRINNLVKSVQDLRASVDTLREMEQRTREDLMVDRARREGRAQPPSHSAVQDESR